MRTIEFELTEKSIDGAIRKLDLYIKDLQAKTSQLAGILAQRVEEYAAYELSKHQWTGETLASLRSVHHADSYSARVIVGGAAVWLEFGTGVVANACSPGTIVHPQHLLDGETLISGIGMYGFRHGSDPNGWWYKDETGQSRHTYGIPATMFMWNATETTRRELAELARGVYAKID